ncbi:MAG: DUF1842 domain-containing protein [Labilibaculum antarcticum]
MANTMKNVGLFNAHYRITNHLVGGVEMQLNLTVNTVNKRITGMAHITQAVNPPVNIISEIQGDFNYMCTMQSCSILVVAEGVSPFQPLIHDVPQVYKNLTLRMVLDENWQKGVANYKYCINNEWHEVTQAQVEIVNDNEIHNIEKLAATVRNTVKEPVV